MRKYPKAPPLLAAVDCIIFGFDGQKLNLLVVKRRLAPEKGKWSLMGGFVKQKENLDQAAARVLKEMTGLDGVYMEQLYSFGDPKRDPEARTISIAYFALIDSTQYEAQLTHEFQAEWFPLKKVPKLIFDHDTMVKAARKQLQYKAALHPLLLELLPAKFTLPQLQLLYEQVFDTQFDKRNFSRKVLSTGLLIKQADKDKVGSRKGAYYYKLNKKEYRTNFQAFLNIIPNAHHFI